MKSVFSRICFLHLSLLLFLSWPTTPLLIQPIKEDNQDSIDKSGAALLGRLNPVLGLNSWLAHFPLLKEAQRIVRTGTSTTLEELGNLRSSLAVAGEKITTLAGTTVKSFEKGSHKVEQLIFNMTKEAKQHLPISTHLKNMALTKTLDVEKEKNQTGTFLLTSEKEKPATTLRGFPPQTPYQAEVMRPKETHVGSNVAHDRRVKEDKPYPVDPYEEITKQHALLHSARNPMSLGRNETTQKEMKDNRKLSMTSGMEKRFLLDKDGYMKIHHHIREIHFPRPSSTKSQTRGRKITSWKKLGKKGVHYSPMTEIQASKFESTLGSSTTSQGDTILEFPHTSPGTRSTSKKEDVSLDFSNQEIKQWYVDPSASNAPSLYSPQITAKDQLFSVHEDSFPTSLDQLETDMLSKYHLDDLVLGV